MHTLASFCSSALAPLSRYGALAVLALPLALAGCDTDEPPVCTADVSPSLHVTVASADGSAPEEVSVRFSVDGSDLEDCAGAATDWICGEEIAGEFTVEVSAAGHESQNHSLTVEADECHVISQQLDVVLDPIECTEEIVSSVLLTLTDNEGTVFEVGSGVWAQWSLAEVDMLPLPCVPSSDGRWECGSEESGPFDIVAGKIGSYVASTEVEVGFDGCHPITEEVELELFNATTPCTEQVQTSIVLTVIGEADEPVSGAEVSYNATWVPWFTSEPCWESGAGVYYCGEELASSIDVSIVADSFVTRTETVFVTSDECHVNTEHRTLSLAHLPD